MQARQPHVVAVKTTQQHMHIAAPTARSGSNVLPKTRNDAGRLTVRTLWCNTAKGVLPISLSCNMHGTVCSMHGVLHAPCQFTDGAPDCLFVCNFRH